MSKLLLMRHCHASLPQDVVPQALLDQYLSMTDPSRAQTVDTEIAKHCAYSLPGVALTLGRRNWHCLRETYETLASDMQVSEAAEELTDVHREGTVFHLSEPSRISVHILASTWYYRKLCAEEFKSNNKAFFWHGSRSTVLWLVFYLKY